MTTKTTYGDMPSVRSHIQEQEGLTSPNLFARMPWIGIFLFFIGSLFFGAFTYNLYTHGPLLQLDQRIATVLPAYGHAHESTLKPWIDSGYYIGGWGPILLGLAFFIYFLAKRLHEEAAMLFFGLVGETAVFEAVSLYINRPRPPTQMWIVLHIPGFPSGHTMAAVVFFGFLAYILVPHTHSVLMKIVLILLALFLMLFVGFTRVFTAAHYLTDVLGGYSLGLAWSGVAYPLIELYYTGKRTRNDRQR